MYWALKSDGFIQGKRSALSHVELWPSSSEDDKNLLSLRFIGYSLKTSTPRRLNARPIPRRSRLTGSALGGIHFLRRAGQCLLFPTPKLETLSSSASPA